MNKYELIFIVKATVEGESYSNLISNYKNLISSSKGSIQSTKDMGKRKLAYEINKEISGFYYVIDFTADTDTIKELDRRLRLDENIVRHLITKLDEE